VLEREQGGECECYHGGLYLNVDQHEEGMMTEWRVRVLAEGGGRGGGASLVRTLMLKKFAVLIDMKRRLRSTEQNSRSHPEIGVRLARQEGEGGNGGGGGGGSDVCV
jgi:hypothetical protein